MRNNYRPGGDRRSRQAPHKRRNNSSKSATIPVNKFINHAVESEREIIYTLFTPSMNLG